jgi:hypothetical protein
MTEPEEAAIDLLLSDPHVVAWLDPGPAADDEGDDEDESPKAA